MTVEAPETWEDHQEWERRWWAGVTNTFSEEAKAITYLHRVGLVVVADDQPDGPIPWRDTWPTYDLGGRNVVDIGGGPVSPLLKCRNRGTLCDVVDPCQYPAWTRERYASVGIAVHEIPAEEFNVLHGYDEAWVLNCLQHVQDPVRVLETAVRCAPVVRLFEWVDVPPCPGHPHELTAALIDGVLGERVSGAEREWIEENGAQGWATYGIWNTGQ
jgi:hypothetical protein